jgi:hypothetical protein
MIRHAAYAVLCASFLAGCKDTSGPATAVTLELYSVDGVVVPAPLLSPTGKRATVARGFLQGTSWGAACGFAVGLAEGPITFLDVADCRLHPGEERKFQVTFSDTRFPTGAHEYRFIPE